MGYLLLVGQAAHGRRFDVAQESVKDRARRLYVEALHVSHPSVRRFHDDRNAILPRPFPQTNLDVKAIAFIHYDIQRGILQ